MELEDNNELERYVPPYLSQSSSSELKEALKNHFPESYNPYKIYLDLEDISIWYQGDCLFELPYFSLDNQNIPKILYCNGLIISNTCMIDSRNQKLSDVDVNLAIVFALEEYIEFLKAEGFSKEQIEGHLISIRSNSLSNVLYLPAFKRGQFNFPESFVRLDRISTFPVAILSKYDVKYREPGDRIFSFSNYGFYLLLYKLSKYFSRFSEGIDREGSSISSPNTEERKENTITLDDNPT